MDIQSAFESDISMPLSGRSHVAMFFAAVASMALMAAPFLLLAH
jgi:hypothetical protein